MKMIKRTTYKKATKASKAAPRSKEDAQTDWLCATVVPPKPSAVKDVSRYARNGAKSKVLGAVYTPPRVADALTRWAVRAATDRVLDPSCGEGVFLATARTRLADLGARRPVPIGVDIDAPTAQQVGAVHADFFAWLREAPRFDVILGNPPFIRSHLFPEESRALAFPAMERLGLKPSRLMSTWAPFLALSCSLLTPATGRLAMVIPEELLSVGYASELRRWLLQRFRRVTVCFPEANIFPEVQQAVVLLLCDHEQNSPSGLCALDYADLEAGDYDAVKSAPAWLWNHKWSHLFLPAERCRQLGNWWNELGWEPISTYGRVEVGIVTGDNDFFTITGKDAARFDARHLVPIITSARDLQGIHFDAEDFAAVLRKNRPAYLLNLRGPLKGLGAAERSHIATGEREHVSQRYKCRVRQPWYAVPGVRSSDAVLLRQSGDMPRLIQLDQRCAVTDTIHRVNWHEPQLGQRHATSFLNTLTLLATELTGRSYGGGVLELMPSEANALPIPAPAAKLDGIFEKVDQLVRTRNCADAVRTVDAVTLPRWMSSADREDAGMMLSRLVARRKARGD